MRTVTSVILKRFTPAHFNILSKKSYFPGTFYTKNCTQSYMFFLSIQYLLA